MNPDISDILADLDRSSSQHGSISTSSVSLSDTTQTFVDHQQLTRFWISERSCPEVLPWPTDLMQRVLDRVRLQIEKIEDLAAVASDPTTSNLAGGGGGGGHSGGGGPSNPNLILSILQSDLSRTQFLIRSLLRCRLSKLSQHSLYYLQQHNSSTSAADSTTPNKPLLLSHSEHAFLLSTTTLLQNYYTSSFLSTLPPQLQSLTDTAGGINMVEPPDTKCAVFVRCLSDRWRSTDRPSSTTRTTTTNSSRTPTGGTAGSSSNWLDGPGSGLRSSAGSGTNRHGMGGDDDEDYEEDGDEERPEGESRHFDMSNGQVWVVRWEDVRRGVLSGALELL